MVGSTAPLQDPESLTTTTSVVKAWEEPVGFSNKSSLQSGHLLGVDLMLPAQKFDLLIVPGGMGLGNGSVSI